MLQILELPLIEIGGSLVLGVGLGLLLGLLVLRVRMIWWERGSLACILFAILLLLAVLLPGVGVEVNGSTRWINLGVFRLQVSEPAKLLALIYMAGYLVRHGEDVRYTSAGFLKPLGLLLIAALLLLMEPDFGATVVLMTTALVMLFMAGVSLWKFGGLIVVAGMGARPDVAPGGDGPLPSGRSTIFRILMNRILDANPSMQAIAIAADKAQKIAHPGYARIERFRVGKRQIALLQRLAD